VRLPLFVLAAAVSALSGCDVIKPRYVMAPEPETIVVTRQVPASTEADELLTYFGDVRALASRDLNQTLLDARLAYTGSNTTGNRLRLATVLVFARETDEAEALSLIEPTLQETDANTRARRAYAHMLYGVVTERRRHRDLASQLQGRSREGKLEVQAARAESKALQDKVDALKQQLDALTSIEKSLATGRK
jgi:hypothetical protein